MNLQVQWNMEGKNLLRFFPFGCSILHLLLYPSILQCSQVIHARTKSDSVMSACSKNFPPKYAAQNHLGGSLKYLSQTSFTNPRKGGVKPPKRFPLQHRYPSIQHMSPVWDFLVCFFITLVVVNDGRNLTLYGRSFIPQSGHYSKALKGTRIPLIF